MTKLEELIWDIRACLEGLTIQSKLYGEGLITQITGTNPNDLIVHIHFDADNEKRFHKAFNIAIALKTKNIILPDYTLKLYNGFIELAREEFVKEKELEKQKKLEEEKLRKEEEERKEAEKQAKKAAQAFERTKKRIIEKFEATASEVSNSTYTNDYYYSLGWLAKNITCIYARMPDYLDSAFTKYFGPEAPRRLENSNDKNCVWTYGFSAHVKNPDTAPLAVKSIMNPNSKDLSASGATGFFWDLIANHGFKFGKIQDIEAIRSYIPKDRIEEFELGYNT